MSEKKYKIVDQYGHTLATSMSLEIALILIKGIVGEYYNESIDLRLVEVTTTIAKGKNDE